MTRPSRWSWRPASSPASTVTGARRLLRRAARTRLRRSARCGRRWRSDDAGGVAAHPRQHRVFSLADRARASQGGPDHESAGLCAMKRWRSRASSSSAAAACSATWIRFQRPQRAEPALDDAGAGDRDRSQHAAGQRQSVLVRAHCGVRPRRRQGARTSIPAIHGTLPGSRSVPSWPRWRLGSFKPDRLTPEAEAWRSASVRRPRLPRQGRDARAPRVTRLASENASGESWHPSCKGGKNAGDFPPQGTALYRSARDSNSS
jgi:hypothetical protein